jgi:hypothetical protein
MKFVTRLRARGVFAGFVAVLGFAWSLPADGSGRDRGGAVRAEARTPGLMAFLPPNYPYVPKPRPPSSRPPGSVTPGRPTVPPDVTPPPPSPPPIVPPPSPPPPPPQPPPPPPPPPGDDDSPSGPPDSPPPPPQVPEPAALLSALVGSGVIGLYGLYCRRKKRGNRVA